MEVRGFGEVSIVLGVFDSRWVVRTRDLNQCMREKNFKWCLFAEDTLVFCDDIVPYLEGSDCEEVGYVSSSLIRMDLVVYDLCARRAGSWLGKWARENGVCGD